MLFYFSLFALTALLVMLLYRYRGLLPLPQRWRSRLQHPSAANYAPLSTFADQAASGMSSSTFDLEADNIREGDSRLGLDEQGAREVRDIMRQEGVAFDQARLIRHNRILAANGIDPSGMPMDAKAITHL